MIIICFHFYILEGIPGFIYIYIHHDSQFLQFGVRNSLTELISLEGTTYLNLELLISHSLSTPSNPCNENASAYDTCIRDQYMDQLIRTNSCLLPFLAQRHGKEISYCNNYEHATKSLNIFQNVSSSCLISCLLVIPDLSLQLEDQYLINSLTRNFFANSGDRKGLFLLLPRDINFIESQNVYTPLTVLDKHFGVYQNTFWTHNLRSGGKPPRQSQGGKPPLHEGSVT